VGAFVKFSYLNLKASGNSKPDPIPKQSCISL